MNSQNVTSKPMTDRLLRLDRVTLKRRLTIFAFCCVAASGVWAGARQLPIPGTDQFVWSLPRWSEALLVVSLALSLFGLFRLGGRFIRDARQLYGTSVGMRSSTKGVRWYRYLNPIGPFYNMYLHRNLLRQFVRREVESQYKGSWLGTVWSIVTPLLMLAIYTFVFSVIFQARWRGSEDAQQGEYAITLFAGLIAFHVFTDIVMRAPSMIITHPNYVKKVIFPLEILPVSAMGGVLFHALINVIILVVANLLLARTLSTMIVFLPLVAVPLIGLSLGVSWFLASLGVYIRDVAYVVGLITQMLFFLSAIFYPIERVPEAARPLIRLNPLAAIVESFRNVLVWNTVPDWPQWLALMTTSGILFLLGYAWFMKTKVGFADVI